MDIKEFVKESLSGIINATIELQQEFEAKGVVINPPASDASGQVFEADSISYTHRRVENVEFDVAVTAAGETSGGGKAGIRIAILDASLDGTHARRSEAVSRVKFTIPISFAPSSIESANQAKRDQRDEELKQVLAGATRRVNKSWMG
ncbi:hypothetical protein [Gemmobacter caeruleus]|uniref:hypothetical protein n=1 Tax=Gemmobacter caeruleus TaxID=2595004 RepID=UPI0011EDAAB7|nr:hypothetical protein [Gemmobacter caeruleus]